MNRRDVLKRLTAYAVGGVTLATIRPLRAEAVREATAHTPSQRMMMVTTGADGKRRFEIVNRQEGA